MIFRAVDPHADRELVAHGRHRLLSELPTGFQFTEGHLACWEEARATFAGDCTAPAALGYFGSARHKLLSLIEVTTEPLLHRLGLALNVVGFTLPEYRNKKLLSKSLKRVRERWGTNNLRVIVSDNNPTAAPTAMPVIEHYHCTSRPWAELRAEFGHMELASIDGQFPEARGGDPRKPFHFGPSREFLCAPNLPTVADIEAATELRYPLAQELYPFAERAGVRASVAALSAGDPHTGWTLFQVRHRETHAVVATFRTAAQLDPWSGVWSGDVRDLVIAPPYRRVPGLLRWLFMCGVVTCWRKVPRHEALDFDSGLPRAFVARTWLPDAARVRRFRMCLPELLRTNRTMHENFAG